ncbi:MAG: hypothetical protein R2856_32890 [Caldilineaceae bacterium]
MFDQSCAQAAFDQKRERFTAYLPIYGWNGSAEGVLERFRQMTAQEIDVTQAGRYCRSLARQAPNHGDRDTAEEMRIPFTERWQNHRTAREWALSILYKRPSLAVDGS